MHRQKEEQMRKMTKQISLVSLFLGILGIVIIYILSPYENLSNVSTIVGEIALYLLSSSIIFAVMGLIMHLRSKKNRRDSDLDYGKENK